MSNFYSIQADKIKFDLDMLVDLYKTVDQTKWVHRQDKLPQYWPIDENSTFDRNHEFYKLLKENILIWNKNHFNNICKEKLVI